MSELSEDEREALTNCDCGHDIDEHNSTGCYAVDWAANRSCGCRETDDRPPVNYAAVERIIAARTQEAVEAALAPIEALVGVTLDWYASDKPLISADQLRQALAAARDAAGRSGGEG